MASFNVQTLYTRLLVRDIQHEELYVPVYHVYFQSRKIYRTLLLGDFLKSEIPPADVYLLSMVVHDWKADVLEELLNTLHVNLNPGKTRTVL